MQVKTKITNPTDKTQHYSWVPRHGVYVAAGGSVVIDGDIHTMNKAMNRTPRQIDHDVATGRVRVELMTDMPVIPMEAPPAKPPPAPIPQITTNPMNYDPSVEPTRGVKVVTGNIEAMAKGGPAGIEASLSTQETILGKGLVEGGIEESKEGEVAGLTTGFEPLQDKPAVENIADELWGSHKPIENRVVEGGVSIDDGQSLKSVGVEVPVDGNMMSGLNMGVLPDKGEPKNFATDLGELERDAIDRSGDDVAKARAEPVPEMAKVAVVVDGGRVGDPTWDMTTTQAGQLPKDTAPRVEASEKAAQAKPKWSKPKLAAKPLKELKKIAKALGLELPAGEEIDKADIIQWILDNQG